MRHDTRPRIPYILRTRRIAALIACIALVGIARPPLTARERDGIPVERLDDVLSAYNRGVALMEQFEPERAVEAFRRASRLAPGWLPARLNLAIALLNTDGEEEREACEEILRDIRESAPSNPHARFTLGMLYLYRGDLDTACEEFSAASEGAPHDPHILYQLSGCAERAGDDARVEKLLEEVIERLPTFSSAYYRLGRLKLRQKKREEAREILKQFQKLRHSRVDVQVAVKYAEMGAYADVLRLVAPAVDDIAETSLRFRVVPQATASSGNGERALCADLDGDLRGDLLLLSRGDAGVRLYLTREGAKLEDVTDESGLDASALGFSPLAAAAGDFDGDGHLDLFLGGAKQLRLLRNEGDGSFRDVTSQSGLAAAVAPLDGNEATPVIAAAAFADLDRDGDLDLFLGRHARRGEALEPIADRLFLNRGTGEFEDATAERGLDEPTISRVVVISDVDTDGSPDVLVGGADSSLRLWRNLHIKGFADDTAARGLKGVTGVRDARAADLDGDGWPELVLCRGGNATPLAFHNRQGRAFTPLPRAPVALRGATSVEVADLDLDGDLELAFSIALDDPEQGRLKVYSLHARDGWKAIDLSAAAAGASLSGGDLASEDLDGDGSIDLVAPTTRGCTLFLGERDPGRHYLRVALRGEQEDAKTFSNRRGVGAIVEVKSRDRWSIRQLALGGSPARPLHFGLGPYTQADYVRILWSDGTLQSELDISAGQTTTIRQVQRKSSSCPVLFTWDGERFRFVTDFLGTGGLGFYLGEDTYAPPDPGEDVRIPPGALRPSEGELRLRIVEPLEEVCYLDEVELLAIDHPRGTEVYPEERFGGVLPAPSGRFVLVEEKRFARRARDAAGNEIGDLLSRVDRRWPRPTRDPRFVGFAREHAIRLDFGLQDASPAALRDVFLFLDGWVEYSYSHVNYAASQAGLALRPPSLDVRGADGRWRTAVSDIGYPAGLPRTMVVPLSEEILRARELRLRTNMDIYWDRAFVARDASSGGAGLEVHRLAPKSASLRYYGFPQEYSPDGGEPLLYSYERRDPGVAFRNIPGDYTRYGEVCALLEETDDRFVIFGRGDEIDVRFDANALPDLPADRERTFVLRSFGYCKDRDAYTAFPDTVEPLPFRSMSGYPYARDESYPDSPRLREYRARWNTRRVYAGEPSSR